MTILLLVLALVLAGCSLAPSDAFMRELAKSERSWCAAITSVYGTMKIGGTGVHSGTMTCTNEGLAVKSDAATVGVPMLVVPQVTIGAPAIILPPPTR